MLPPMSNAPLLAVKDWLYDILPLWLPSELGTAAWTICEKTGEGTM